MPNGNWNEAINSLRHIVKDETPSEDHIGRAMGERHVSILRQKLLDALAVSVAQGLVNGERAHQNVGEQIDGITQTILEQSSTQGVDLDADLLDHLTTISAKLFSIQEVWDEIKTLCNQ